GARHPKSNHATWRFAEKAFQRRARSLPLPVPLPPCVPMLLGLIWSRQPLVTEFCIDANSALEQNACVLTCGCYRSGLTQPSTTIFIEIEHLKLQLLTYSPGSPKNYVEKSVDYWHHRPGWKLSDRVVARQGL